VPYKRGYDNNELLEDKTNFLASVRARGPNHQVLMGHSFRAKKLYKVLKNIGFDGNFAKYWWVTYNFSKSTCGCSICNEHVELVKPDQIVQCRLRLTDAASVLNKFREHENSPWHIGVLKKLGMPSETKRKASEVFVPRKRRKVEKHIRSGTCIQCGYYGEANIELNETSSGVGKDCDHSLTFGRFADQLLYDHLAHKCGCKLKDHQVELQLKQFKVGKYNMYDLITMFNDRPPVVWEGLGIDVRAEQVLSKHFMRTKDQMFLPELPSGEPPTEDRKDVGEEEDKQIDKKNVRFAPGSGPEAPEVVTPDRRWIWKAIFHVGLQTEWSVQNIWSREENQKELRRMWENDPSTPAPGSLVIMEKEILSCAHRLLIEHTFGDKLEGIWEAFYTLAVNRAKSWIHSEIPIESWIGHSVSVWWSSTAKWNRGRITGINPQDNEVHIDYGDDYDETLRLQESTLRFFNAAPNRWWLEEKIDVKWDGEHEWYPASVDSVVGDGENHIKVKYSDSSKEDISIDSHCFYFIQDKVDRVHPFISHLCLAILNKKNLPLMYVSNNDKENQLEQMGGQRGNRPALGELR